MLISYNWIKDYIKSDLSAVELAEILTDIGLEVEGLEKRESIKGGLKGVVVAEVLTRERHPNADRLSLLMVATGEEVPLQIVCGAPNVAAGQKVILATVGSWLYPLGAAEGFEIKKSKIRGEDSFGMICSEKELGLGESEEGIMVLPPETVVGTKASELFKLSEDYILEIGLTPNRSDAASHFGVARDLGVYLRQKALLPSVEKFKTENESLPVEIKIENSELAPRYMGVTMSGITVGSSPEWLQAKLRSIGINPKNSVVDITNFVMYECGQPLHAFDLDTIEGGQIIVRKAEKDSNFKTLDEVERKLSDEDLMICSSVKPMCIAGVFGGINSGVSNTTTKIFIESAYFNPTAVRRSARRHGLNTDSSFRFERGADPEMAPYALKRAALLIQEIAGGSVTSKIIDKYPNPIKWHRIEVSYERMNRLIGKEIPTELVDEILHGLEIETVERRGESIVVSVPPYRVDVKCEADVVEEILRIYGYNNIENPPYIKNVITSGNQQTTERLIESLSTLLSSVGYIETMNNSLTKESYYKELESYKLENCVRILNPLSIDLNVMRQTLLFNGLETVQLNVNRKNQDLLLYELGNCYSYNPEKADKTLRPYTHQKRLSLIVTGHEQRPTWQEKGREASLYTVKSAVEKIFERFGLNIYEGKIEPLTSDLYDESVCYQMRGSQLFEMGVVAKRVLKQVDIKVPVYYLELDIDKLQQIVNSVNVEAKELSKFQPVSRDLALLVDNSVTFAQLYDAAIRGERKLLTNVMLFDVYEGTNLPTRKKSYALNFTLENSERTLKDTEIDQAMQRIAQAIEKETGATIRSN